MWYRLIGGGLLLLCAGVWAQFDKKYPATKEADNVPGPV